MDEKRKPTKSQVETLMSDWLEGTRDSETFIHKNTEGAIRRKNSDGALSEYARGRIDESYQPDVLRMAREIAQGVVDGMTDEPIRVVIGSNESYTDGMCICVSSDYFDDPKLKIGEKVDILTGYAIHEACHIRHSDFGQLKKQRDDNPRIDELKRMIDNILEDERIEHLLGESQDNGGDGMPGLTDYIGCCKKHSFGTYERGKGGMQMTEKIPAFLDALMGAVRYPAMLTEDMVTENFDALDAVRKTLRPFPKSPKGVMAATDRIVDIMKDMLDDDDRQNEQNGGNSSQQQQQQSQQEQQNQQGKPSQGGKKDASKKLSDALSSPQAQTQMAAARQAQNSPEGGTSANDASCVSPVSGEKDYINGEAEKDTGPGAGGRNTVTFIHHAKGSRMHYDLSLSKVRRYIPAMAKALRCKTNDQDYALQGEKSGKLNTNKLVSMKTGNTNIFTRRGTVTSDKACLCLLIDESGSMSQNRRKEATREAAVLMNEAVRHLANFQLFIYGFGDEDITIYAENGREDRWALGSTKAKGGTPTAEGMRIAAARIRRVTQDACLMIILTDGEPNDVAATMEQDALLPKKGILPIGVDIMGATRVTQVFSNSITTTDMTELAPNIAKFIKKKLSKMLKKHDSAA